MKKIAILSFYSGVVSRGVETLIHEISNRLTDFGLDITVYQIGNKVPESRYKTVQIPLKIDWNKKSSQIPFFNYYSLMVKKFTSKVLQVVDKRTDIIFPTNGQWQSFLCSVWAKLNKKKIIIAGFSGVGLDDRLNIYAFPDVFLPMSEKALLKANKINPFVKSVVIPGGVDLNKFKKFKKVKNNYEKVVLTVGAFTKQKRHNLVIEAVSKLKNVKLIIAGGGGDLKDEINKLCIQKLGVGRFEIIETSNEKMPEVYNMADVFTLASETYESFGVVLVEAMACNLPVVATNDPIRREIVGNAGLFVDPNDTDGYAKALEKALQVNWGEEPRKQAERFDWDKIAKKYEEILNSL